MYGRNPNLITYRNKQKPVTSCAKTCVKIWVFLLTLLFLATAGLIAWIFLDTTTADICTPQPCLNGGTCVQLSSSDIACLCNYGFFGLFCENYGCTDSSQALTNQTTITGYSVYPTFILTFQNSSHEKLYLVSNNSIQIMDVDTQVVQPIFSTGLPDIFKVSLLNNSAIYAFSRYCSGTQDCVEILLNGEVKNSLTASTLASRLGAFTLYTILQVDARDVHETYISLIAGPTTQLTVWSRDLSTFVSATDITRYANSTDMSMEYDPFSSRMYVQTNTSVVWFLANNTNVAVNFFTINSVTFPEPTYVSIGTIASFTVKSAGNPWIIIRFGNWTFTTGVELYHYNPAGVLLNSTDLYTPFYPTPNAISIYGSLSGNLYATDSTVLVYQKCLTDQQLLPDNCDLTYSVYQGGACRCIYPQFNGTYPNCYDINECANNYGGCVEYRSCFNYFGGFGCYTTGAVLTSWWSVYATLGPHAFINMIVYTACSFTPVQTGLSTFVCGIGSARLGNNYIGQTYLQTTMNQGEDDRDLCMTYYEFDLDQATAYSYPSFHISNRNLIYLYRSFFTGDPSDPLISLFNLQTGQIVSNLILGTISACATVNIYLPDMIRQDADGTVWYVLRVDGSPTTYVRVRVNETLSSLITCNVVGTSTDFCSSLGFLDGGGQSGAFAWSCHDRSYVHSPLYAYSRTYAPLTTSVLNYTLYSNPLLLSTSTYATVPFFNLNDTYRASSILTDGGNGAHVCLTDWQIASTKLVPNQVVIHADSSANIVSSTTVAERFMSFITSSGQGVAQTGNYAYTDYRGSILFMSQLMLQYAQPSTPSNIGFGLGDAGMTLLTLGSGNPCATSNGGCGNRFCVQTVSANSRCDVCQRFSYPVSYSLSHITFLYPSFTATIVFTDPFLSKISTQKLFVAGSSPNSLFWLDNNGGILSQTALGISFPVFGFAMSIDTHSDTIFAIARSYSLITTSTVISKVNYITSTNISSVLSTSMNLTMYERTYATKAFTIDRVRVIWVLSCASVQCVLSKWYSTNMTMINYQNLAGTGTSPFEQGIFSYDYKSLFYINNGFFTVFRILLGGLDYVPQYFGQVLGPGYGPTTALTGSTFFSGVFGPFTVSNFAFTGVVVFRSSSQATWLAIQIYDHVPALVNEVPFLMTSRLGVSLSSVNATMIHFSYWGDVLVVLSNGQIVFVQCAI